MTCLFITWLKVLRDEYITNGIKCLESKCLDYYVRVESEFSEQVSLNPSHDIKFYSEGYLPFQYTHKQSAYSCHLFCSECGKWSNLLVSNSVSKIYNKQLNNSSSQGLCFGNLTSLKSQDCLWKVKAELKSKKRFSNLYMEDATATQQYFRYLLPEFPLPGYVQYFVLDPFIIYMHFYKQTEIQKLMNSEDIVLNLDVTGSVISKPLSCSKNAMPSQNNTQSFPPVPSH